MRRKRLQHFVDNLCQMFCGWETIFDYNALLELGEGTLKIDALTGNCFFNEKSIEQLNVAKGLQQWISEDSIKNKIDLSYIVNAELTVDLKYSKIQNEQREHSIGEMFLIDGQNVENVSFHRCEFNCNSILQTDEKMYTSTYFKIKEWPIGWPQSNHFNK